MTMSFLDRSDAGRRLANRMLHLRGKDVVVLALPRGGVPVAAEVALALGAPLDVIVVRKLGVPVQPELGMGAIGEGDVRIINPEVVAITHVTDAEIAAVERRERAELDRRARRFRGDRPRTPLAGRTAVIVDDGIATGSTARAACQVARAQGAARVVLAVPVAPPAVCAALAADADEVICLETPGHFLAIGEWYRDFSQTGDREVVSLLRAAAERGPAGAAHQAGAARPAAASGAADRPDPGAGPASPVGGPMPPAGAPAPPTGGPASPAGAPAPPTDGPASPAGGPAPPTAGLASPAGGPASPAEGPPPLAGGRAPALATAPWGGEVVIAAGSARLAGHLSTPGGGAGMVVFAHGSGSGRRSPRNRFVADVLATAGLGTLLFDLLTAEEEQDRANVFDIGLLASRLGAVTRWVHNQPALAAARVGYFGASTGAAAALWAAAEPGAEVAAVVSRGGRPDLAMPRLAAVQAPTLLIVGALDDVVLGLNREAQRHLRCENQLAVVPGASHLFEEPGTLEQAAGLARDWFTRYLAPAHARA
jgi:putative phosphoribosyl transferase